MSEKIDMFTHILPLKYKKALDRKAEYTYLKEKTYPLFPGVSDLEARFRVMDSYEGFKQVLTISLPALEMVVDVASACELAKIANDEMAELIAKYPERFVAAVACLPMNSIDAALREADRAIRELGFKGVQIYTPTNGKPLDNPEFIALYEKMCEYDLPIWIHPARAHSTPDYVGESHSRYSIASVIGWPYETTVAMTRLVFSGILEKYPHIKFITHHGGGMLPFFGSRIAGERSQRRIAEERGRELSRLPMEYFRMFYSDTATIPSVPSLMCVYAFFSPDHMVFGTDLPSIRGIDQTINAIESMDIPDFEKKKIFEGNAKRLLRLA